MPSDIAASAAATQVTAALKRASAATGAGFDFLVAMARRESSLDPSARAKTSSAAGLFQFIEQTWLGAVKLYGTRHGLGAYAGDIVRGADGRFAVADDARREEILNLRFDANASAALAGELANENRATLEARLGRAASAADLYMAHFLGPAGAVRLLSAAASAKAADLLPQAAAANRAVFYDGARAKTVGEVIASVAASMGEGAAAAPSAGEPSGGSEIARAFAAENTYTDEIDLPAPARSEAPLLRAAPLLPDGRLSALAMSVLQALDPTRLGLGREKPETRSRNDA